MASDTVLSILVLAVIAMLAGAWLQWRRGGASKQVWLMLVLALVIAANVAIWAVPTANSPAPVRKDAL